MTDGWHFLRKDQAYGGYVAWETAVERPAPAGRRNLVPVYVRLRPSGLGALTLAEAIAATLDLPDIVFSQHEADLLETDLALATSVRAADGWPFEVRLVAWCPRALLADVPPCWEVLHVGPSVVMEPAQAVPSPVHRRALPCGVAVAPEPVLAAIDDGIAFLNTRFRASRMHTRMAAVWLQAQERLVDDAMSRDDDVLCGRVLTGPEIDAMLDSGGSEAQMYGQVNRSLHPGIERSPTNHRVAHGTHVLDLAAGADPWRRQDPMCRVPLLAVQLPPAAIRDTSGRRLEGYVVQGLRWLVTQVLRRAVDGKVPPLVVNLSVGSLAGPGDETAFLASWMRYEMDRHTRMAPGADLRIVAAYGNARRGRLVARGELRRAAPLHLDWRLQPDDHTPSFLELRVDAGKTRGLRLRLVPPVGSGIAPLQVDWPLPGEGWRNDNGAGPRAAVVSSLEADHALLHLTVAPSAGLGPVALAQAGLWRVELATLAAEPVRVTGRVQRDDTPFSYRTLGRQSWLDHAEGWDWDVETRSHTAPSVAPGAPGCPITREGTAVAFAGADHPGIYFVAAVRPETGQPGQYRESTYSAGGVVNLLRPGESVGPSLAACSDEGVMIPGQRAAAVLSGSVTRMSGTSMAAPLVARRLVEYFIATPPAAGCAQPPPPTPRPFWVVKRRPPFRPASGMGC